MTTRSSAKPRFLPGSPFYVPPGPAAEEYAVGDRVTHDSYGLGRVVAEDSTAITVDFGSQRVRIASPFQKLSKL